MGAGKTLKQAYQRQNDITNRALDLSQSTATGAQTAFGQRTQQLQKPLDFYNGVASGDPAKMLAAAAPGITNISKQAQSAKGSIMDTVAPGAARNFALAQIDRDKFGQNAQFLNQAFLSAFPALQGIASDTGNFGLQQLGASLNSMQQGSQGNQQIIQNEAQRKAAKMNMIGGIASMAGGGLAAGIPKMFGGASKAGASASSNMGNIHLPNLSYMPPTIPNSTPPTFINFPLNQGGE